MYASTTIIGRLGRDPETRSTQAGNTVTTFSVATDEWNPTKKETTTQWYDCVLWGDTGKRVSESMKKGDRIMAEGRMRSRKYTPRGSDQERIVWELIVDRHRRIDFKKAEKAEQKPTSTDDDEGWDDPPATKKPAPAVAQTSKRDDFEDDIPF